MWKSNNQSKNYNPMKTKRTMSMMVAFLLMASTGLMGGCIPIPDSGVKGDGNVVKEDRAIKSFTSLEVSGAFKVFLYQGKSESLTVEADQNLMQYIKTVVKGDRLEIYTDEEISRPTKLNIYLTFEQLEMIDISGAVSVKGDERMTFGELNIDGSGASDLELIMDVDALEADFSGASEIELSGQARWVKIDLSGASEIDAYDFIIESCELDVSGAAEVKIHVTGNLDVDVSGAASVNYKGSPKVQSDVSGAGSLRSK
jgi:hypothetical protein